MHFPSHWAKATWRGLDSDGNPIGREAWGWSDMSEDDARRHGEERARRSTDTASAGCYGYPDRPLREPVLRTLADGTGGVNAVITRNTYGCDVLNTDRVVFIDVDLPELPPPAKPGFLSLFFGKPKAAPTEDPRIAIEADKISLLENWQQRHPELSFRVYRTAAGLRYLLTSALLAPDDPLVADAMEATGADPDYCRLCRVQKSFRARLTPKPWRCGTDNPPHRFPFSGARKIAAMEKWQAAYARAAYCHATCLHLIDIGTAPVATAIQPLVLEHDRLTHAESSLPLA
jgi:hypothetical protein